MKLYQSAAIFVRLLLALFLIAAPLCAQRRRPVAPRQPPTSKLAQPALTFETVIAADSYRVYGEVRGVGQLLRSAGVKDVVDPVMKLAAPPKEFKTLVRWLNSHADALLTSRLMFALWPSRPKLPQALFVIEFPSVDEAQKFEPKLREFLPKLLPTPVPGDSSGFGHGKGEPLPARPMESSPPPPSYIMKQSGALVLISDSQFTFKALRPTGSKLLSEDLNFRQVHDRLSSESVFVYFDVASAEKEDRERLLQMEEEEKKRQEYAVANPTPPEVVENRSDPVTPQIGPEDLPAIEVDQPQPVGDTSGTFESGPSADPSLETSVPGPSGLDRLATALFFGSPKWPEAIGVAIAFDAETYIVRALLINGPEGKGNVIPFAPQLVAGPPLVPEASSVMPANTELLVTLSLDFPLIYEGLVKQATRANETYGRTVANIKASQPESPFAVYEKKLGLKIKEDVLPLFGNEVALSLPIKTLGVSGPQSPAPAEPSSGGEGKEDAPVSSRLEPVIAVAIRDREAVRTLIPKIIDVIGFKGAGQLAQTEKRDDTELVTFANVISYAFIGSFMIISPDAKAVRSAVDSYLNHQTLAGNSSFRNSIRWQPRQVLGQVYLSPALMESYSGFSNDLNLLGNDAFRDFLSRLSPTSEPVTYSISNEGLGPLHELHIPKNLVLLMIAGISSENSQPPLARNEAMAQSSLRTMVSAQEAYRATKGDGNFGSFDQLVEQSLLTKEQLQQNGYKIELTVMGTKFEATAVPLEYGKSGKMSFFIDESGVLRGADNGGGSATSADKPLR